MSPSHILDALLVVSIVLALLVTLFAMAALGRKIADLELQIARGIEGVPRIQSEIVIRSQLGDALFGLVFLVINIMLLAAAPLEWRQWTFRLLWTALLLLILAHKVMDYRAERRQVRLLVDAQASTNASLREMTEQAIGNLERAAAATQMAAGGPLVPPLAPVVPEHSSPITDQQRETAHIATMRARLVAANLALGLSPLDDVDPSVDRHEAPHGEA